MSSPARGEDNPAVDRSAQHWHPTRVYAALLAALMLRWRHEESIGKLLSSLALVAEAEREISSRKVETPLNPMASLAANMQQPRLRSSISKLT